MATAYVYEHRRLTAADSLAALCDCSHGDLFGLVLTNIDELSEPVAARGAQGVWNWRPEATALPLFSSSIEKPLRLETTT